MGVGPGCDLRWGVRAPMYEGEVEGLCVGVMVSQSWAPSGRCEVSACVHVLSLGSKTYLQRLTCPPHRHWSGPYLLSRVGICV
jgi:hypothetical protein